jgi:hypothetical protein
MPQRSPVLRFAAAAAFAAAALLPASCGSATPKASGSSSAVAEFRNGYLAFRRPTAWKPFVFKNRGALHFDPMLYLSSQPAHPPCRTNAAETVCGWPVDRLLPGGALVVWENRGAPNWSLASLPGADVRIGGRDAKRTVSRPGKCAAIGADETIEATIERPMPDNWTAFTACLRGPGLAASERRIDALLGSTRFLAP